MRYKDLKGNVYGQLLVLEYSHTNGQRTSVWKCLCTCGVLCLKDSHSLNRKQTISCGCYTPNRVKDITNQTFGRLTVKSFYKIDKINNVSLWNCECTCGKDCIVRGTSLRYGVKSCGCLADENPKGNLSPAWKGGITPSNLLERTTVTYLAWRKSIFTRDNYTCQKCKIKGKTLHAHHIESFATNKALRTDLSNGVCMCQRCHLNFHKLYGKTNNNSTQLKEYFT